MMDTINDTVAWYQAKIGAYDKQLWEKSVEQAVLKNIHNLPKKKTTVKQELIDVDLVRGSTFSKAKPQHGWLSVAVEGMFRLIFLPIYIMWWQRQTSRWLGATLLILYALQVITMCAYYSDSGHNVNAERLSLAHLVSPVLLMITLAIIHAQIVATHASFKQRREHRTSPTRKVVQACKSVKRKKLPGSAGGGGGSRFSCTKTSASLCDTRWLERASSINRPPSSATITHQMIRPCKCEGGYQSGDEEDDSPRGGRGAGRKGGMEDRSPKVRGRRSRNSSGAKRTKTLKRETGSDVIITSSDAANGDAHITEPIITHTTHHILNNASIITTSEERKDVITIGCSEVNGADGPHGAGRADALDGAANVEAVESSGGGPVNGINGIHEINGIQSASPAASLNGSTTCPPLSYKPLHACEPVTANSREYKPLHACEPVTANSREYKPLHACEPVIANSREYKPLHACEPVTANSEEMGQDLNVPIQDTSGSLLLADKLTGLDFLYDDLTVLQRGKEEEEEETRMSPVHCHYVPLALEAEEGNIDLYGIKHRRKSETVAPAHRHKKTSRIDQQETIDHSTVDNAVAADSTAVVSSESTTDCYSGARPKTYHTVHQAACTLQPVTRHTKQSLNHNDETLAPNDTENSEHKLSMKQAPHVCNGGGGGCVIRDTRNRNRMGSRERTRNRNRMGQSKERPAAPTPAPAPTPGMDSMAEKEASPVLVRRRGAGGHSHLHAHSTGGLHTTAAGGAGGAGSSAESDTADPAQGVETSELDWADSLNNADTTSTDTTTTSCSENDLSGEEGELGLSDAAEESGDVSCTQSVQHVNSVMNNLSSSTDKVSCLIWEGEEVKKADLTVLDVGWSIIQRVDKIPLGSDYVLFGVALSVFIMLLPPLFKAYHSKLVFSDLDWTGLAAWYQLGLAVLGNNWREILVVVNGIIQRLFLCQLFFFLLSVAERTFKQRLLYAKHFCYLTSSRRAKKYELPHFRLNKVTSIKTWLSLRSYLKKRGPQRSVDSIVSAAFFIAITFVSLMCIELLHDSGAFLDHLGNWELVVYCMGLGVYMLRFITLGSKINKKYRNFSVLITEQINLYLRMEQKPDKKDELMLANNVLKLAEALLKELESPFKVSGLSANPFLYNVTKVVILSAFSAVLTELLGFKLKLYKIKIKA